jgi:hypothetical protein
MKLELPPELEASLANIAEKLGLSPEAYAVQVLSQHMGGSALTLAGPELSPEEWIRELRAWSHSHDADNLPILSDEATSRESIYD